jgi:hypothetical protein
VKIRLRDLSSEATSVLLVSPLDAVSLLPISVIDEDTNGEKCND